MERSASLPSRDRVNRLLFLSHVSMYCVFLLTVSCALTVYCEPIRTPDGSPAVISVDATRLSSTKNPSTAGDQVTLIALVVPPPGSSSTPTGSVTFWDGLNPLGTSALGNGTATLDITFSDPGSHFIAAEYNGDSSFSPSISPVLTQVVLRPPPVFSVLYKFCSLSQCADGYNPLGALVRDGAGNLYGTTYAGGSTFGTYDNGGGTVFKVNTAGHEIVLHNFCSAANCADGQLSYAGLILDSAGNLYGTTSQGGANNWGTVFKINMNGQESVLYSFCSAANCADGQLPYAGLIRDGAGNLYGTTTSGGANNGGTVFKLDAAGHETVLYSFCSATNCTDGQLPYAGLIQDAAGNLYGTTYGGGAIGAGNFPGGTVFKLDTAGHETVLYSFCSAANCTDGKQPYAGLVMDDAGNLYGTTSGGGAHGFMNTVGGTAFKLDPSGHEKVLHSFCSTGGVQCTDGEMPLGGLVLDSAGNLYGTTAFGGANELISGNGIGVVFRVTVKGEETVLYNFCSALNCSDGLLPYASLIQDAEGNLYGTTSGGGIFDPNCAGAFSCGTVFKLAFSRQADRDGADHHNE